MPQSFNPEPSAIRTARMLSYHTPRPVSSFPTASQPKVGLKQPRIGRAAGGGIPDSPAQPFTGPIYSRGSGRADDVPMHVPTNSYVLPADIVSHVGDGNTMTGLSILKLMFGPHPYGATSGPYGSQMPQGAKGPGVPMPQANLRPQQPARPGVPVRPVAAPPPQPGGGKHGGHVEGDGPASPIMASGGEFVIPPDEVKRRGGGDYAKGHKYLDAWVMSLRKDAIKTLKKLPGPAQ